MDFVSDNPFVAILLFGGRHFLPSELSSHLLQSITPFDCTNQRLFCPVQMRLGFRFWMRI